MQKITNDTSSTTVANKIAQWQAGFVTQATLEGAFASMLATDSDHSTVSAIVAMINDAGSSVQVSADHVDLSGVDIFVNARDAHNNVNITGRGLFVTNRTTADYSNYMYDMIADGYSAEFKVVATPVGSGDPITFRVSPTSGVSQYSGSGSSAIEYFSLGSEEGQVGTGIIEWANIQSDNIVYVNIADKTTINGDGSGSTANGNISWNDTGKLLDENIQPYTYSIKIKPGGTGGSAPSPYNGLSKYIQIGDTYLLFLNGILVYCDSTPRASWSGAQLDDQGVDTALRSGPYIVDLDFEV